MKRTYRFVALLLLLAFVLGVTAQADLIIERNHSFLHRDLGCEPYERIHIINSSEGAVKVYASPGGKAKLFSSPEGKIVSRILQNGIQLKILCISEDGAWGFVDYSTGLQLVTGWIKLDETVPIYDGQSFLDEHENEFYPDDGTAIQMLENVSRPYTYDYPGAPASFSKVMNAEELVENNFVFELLYQDKDGRIWGYMGKTVNGRGWVCLSEPTSKELPVVEYQTIHLYPAESDGTQSNLLSAWLLPTCLVVGVVIVSGLLLLVLKRKK